MGFLDLTHFQRRYAEQAGQLVNEFYIPVLSQATRYDRQAGYFDSAALVQIAAGLAAFIENLKRFPPTDRPPMRLISGATWSAEDIEAYRRGLDSLTASLERTAVLRLEPTDAECQLLPQQAEGMTPYLARETPLAVHMFRHTRQTLDAYRDRGLLRAGLADRQPEDVPIRFQSTDEEKLYNRMWLSNF